MNEYKKCFNKSPNVFIYNLKKRLIGKMKYVTENNAQSYFRSHKLAWSRANTYCRNTTLWKPPPPRAGNLLDKTFENLDLEIFHMWSCPQNWFNWLRINFWFSNIGKSRVRVYEKGKYCISLIHQTFIKIYQDTRKAQYYSPGLSD